MKQTIKPEDLKEIKTATGTRKRNVTVKSRNGKKSTLEILSKKTVYNIRIADSKGSEITEVMCLSIPKGSVESIDLLVDFIKRTILTD
jgi:hypothetical protein